MYSYSWMLCCLSGLHSPTHPSIKEAGLGRLHNRGAAAPLLWIPLWIGVCGGCGGVDAFSIACTTES